MVVTPTKCNLSTELYVKSRDAGAIDAKTVYLATSINMNDKILRLGLSKPKPLSSS